MQPYVKKAGCDAGHPTRRHYGDWGPEAALPSWKGHGAKVQKSPFTMSCLYHEYALGLWANSSNLS